MKIILISVFSLLTFWFSENSTNLKIDDTVGPTTSICFEHKGGRHCENFNDGYSCDIWIFEGGSGDAIVDDPDC